MKNLRCGVEASRSGAVDLQLTGSRYQGLGCIAYTQVPKLPTWEVLSGLRVEGIYRIQSQGFRIRGWYRNCALVQDLVFKGFRTLMELGLSV